jgi:hypothetical protein
METVPPSELTATLIEFATHFAAVVGSGPLEAPPASLDAVLVGVAKTGIPQHSWKSLRELFAAKAATVADSFRGAEGIDATSPEGRVVEARREAVVASIRRYEAAPFTLQRLAEVLLEPKRQYKSTTKYLNGVEKLLMVSSTLPCPSDGLGGEDMMDVCDPDEEESNRNAPQHSAIEMSQEQQPPSSTSSAVSPCAGHPQP